MGTGEAAAEALATGRGRRVAAVLPCWGRARWAPEVGDLEVAARVEKQVLGLEVAVVLMRLWQNLTAVTSC